MKNEQSPFGYNLAKILVLNRIKKELGLDRVEKLYFGAAPMNQSTKNFFIQLNMPVVSIYGLSESSGGSTIMEDYTDIKMLNKCGKAFPGSQIKIFNPDE